MHVYFDNAATTPIDPEVLDAMMPWLSADFGNPSSIHAHGRQARAAIEKARKSIAALLNTSPSEIFFTSCGTESDNTVIQSSVLHGKVNTIITSPIEHHAVLHTAQAMDKAGLAGILYVRINEKGIIDLDHLAELISENKGSLVALMHANNELGNITPIDEVGKMAHSHQCVFLSDTVQTVGHLPIDLNNTSVDFISGSAHKFHGPKGIGFLYINADNKIAPLLYGGSQERNMRGGTENVAGIIGMAKALEKAVANMEEDKKHILSLKLAMMKGLQEKIPGVEFNGQSGDKDQSLYTVLSAALPESDNNDMLLFNLDINKISASGGSACTSGTDIGSHVLKAIGVNPRKGHVRFSFSKLNNMNEVNYTVTKIEEVLREWEII